MLAFSHLQHGMSNEELTNVCLHIQEFGPLFLNLAKAVNRPLYLHSSKDLARSIQYFPDGQTIIHLKTQKGNGLPPIGAGGQSRVTKSLHYDSAIIIANSSVFKVNNKQRKFEMMVMKKLQGIPGIPKIYGDGNYYSKKTCKNKPNYKANLLVDFYSKGQFKDGARAPKSNTEQEFFINAKQLLRTVGEVHKKGYVHRDIKPENIVVNEKGELGLIDFGLCNKMDTKIKDKGGTPSFMPPECFNKIEWNLNGAIDIWALGIIFYQMHYGRSPEWFAKSDQEDTVDNLLFSAPQNYEKGAPYEEPKEKDTIEHLIWEMLDVNPEKRITAEEALKKIKLLEKPNPHYIIPTRKLRKIDHFNPYKITFPENEIGYKDANCKLQPGDIIVELDRGQLKGMNFSILRRSRQKTLKKNNSFYKAHHAQAYHFYIYSGERNGRYLAIDAMPDKKHGVRQIDFFRDHSTGPDSVYKVFRCRSNISRKAAVNAFSLARPKKYLFNDEKMSKFDQIDKRKSNEFSFYKGYKALKENAFDITFKTKKRSFKMIADYINCSTFATGGKNGRKFFCSSFISHVYQLTELGSIWDNLTKNHPLLKYENEVLKSLLINCKNDYIQRHLIISNWSQKMAEEHGNLISENLKIMKLDPKFTSSLDLYKFLEDSPEFGEVLEIHPKIN